MLALAEIFSARWLLFILAILVALALDLGVLHRRARAIGFREALWWTAIWLALSMLFAVGLAPRLIDSWHQQQTNEFITGYILELSLSMDNVFVMALIFSSFQVPLRFQHRILFWGIIGAMVMRGVMIACGIALIHRFSWMFYFLGGFLVFTGIKMLLAKEEDVQPDQNWVIRLVRVLFPISREMDGPHFVTRHGGRWLLTPLALVLVMVETTDLLFAIDSIPAILGVTQNPYVVFTSNVCAILGLRSLYFLLAGAIDYFRYLKSGLALILTFIGGKMLLANTRWQVSTDVSLGVVAAILVVSIILSLVALRRQRRAGASKRE